MALGELTGTDDGFFLGHFNRHFVSKHGEGLGVADRLQRGGRERPFHKFRSFFEQTGRIHFPDALLDAPVQYLAPDMQADKDWFGFGIPSPVSQAARLPCRSRRAGGGTFENANEAARIPSVVSGESAVEISRLFLRALLQGLEIKDFKFGAQFLVFGRYVVEAFGKTFDVEAGSTRNDDFAI